MSLVNFLITKVISKFVSHDRQIDSKEQTLIQKHQTRSLLTWYSLTSYSSDTDQPVAELFLQLRDQYSNKVNHFLFKVEVCHWANIVWGINTVKNFSL